MSTLEIEQMSTNERLETMEKLWSSLTYGDGAIKSPEWHGEILDSRKEHANSSDATFYTIEEAKAKLSS